MLSDCQSAFPTFSGKGIRLSSLNEFKYVAERHPRFHSPLAFVQSQFLPTELPFIDIDVMSMAMSAPRSFRAYKGILD